MAGRGNATTEFTRNLLSSLCYVPSTFKKNSQLNFFTDLLSPPPFGRSCEDAEESCRRSLEEVLGALMEVSPAEFMPCLTECGNRTTLSGTGIWIRDSESRTWWPPIARYRKTISQRESETTIKIKFAFFRGGWAGGAERKIVQNDFIFRGKRHDNIILKVKIVLSRNFVVMAQAPNLSDTHLLHAMPAMGFLVSQHGQLGAIRPLL